MTLSSEQVSVVFDSGTIEPMGYLWRQNEVRDKRKSMKKGRKGRIKGTIGKGGNQALVVTNSSTR